MKCRKKVTFSFNRDKLVGIIFWPPVIAFLLLLKGTTVEDFEGGVVKLALAFVLVGGIIFCVRIYRGKDEL